MDLKDMKLDKKDLEKITDEAEKLAERAEKLVDSGKDQLEKLVDNGKDRLEKLGEADKNKDSGASGLGKKVDELTHGKTDLEAIGSALDGLASKILDKFD